MNTLPPARVHELLDQARRTRLLVVGDLMLDQFIWGRVSRISPEAPVPVVEFERESFVPGGAANVARNLTTLNAHVELFGVVGRDPAARQVTELLAAQGVGCSGVLEEASRMTTRKIRVIAHQQQVARVDRETRSELDAAMIRRLMALLRAKLPGTDGVIVGDYGKGVVTQSLLDELKSLCREHGIWISFDPKPTHRLDLSGLSLITPNRKEAYELAERFGERPGDDSHLSIQPGGPCQNAKQSHLESSDPLADASLMRVAQTIMSHVHPALLLVTLGDQGMLLCQRSAPPFHIPTVAQEVFDVSGAGDTVIASFTLAVAAGASPAEAAILSNHAAGVVVGKIGTSTVSPEELLASFQSSS